MPGHSWDPGVPFYLPLDLETTGLDPDADPIIEVAWGILDYRLDDVAPIQSRVATPTHQSEDRLAANDYVRNMHTENGLLSDQRAGVDIHLSAIEAAIIAQILALEGTPALVLFGSSVHSDRRFIEAQMPTLYRLLHYRIFDVTTALNLFGAAGLWEDHPRPIAHRAAHDITWSISEARRMRTHLRRTWDLAVNPIEPDWEYGRDRGHYIEADEYSPNLTTHRRRSAGEWEPITQEADR